MDPVGECMSNKFKSNFKSLIEKYNDSSWGWVPNQFMFDYLEATEGTVIHPTYKIKTDKKELESNKRDYDAIFELEKEITNPLFFWSIIQPIYKRTTFSQVYLDRFKIAFTRTNRLEVILKNRQNCIKRYKEKVRDTTTEEPSPVTRTLQNKINKKIKKQNKELIVYRGFSIRKDDDVRVGRFKIDNPKAEQQESGLGFSYTLDRKCANFFANQFKIESGVFPFGKAKIVWEGSNSKGQIPNYVDKSLIDKNSRRVVANYSIQKKDILFYDADYLESEIVVLPDKTKLIRYDFLNPNDIHKHPVQIYYAGG